MSNPWKDAEGNPDWDAYADSESCPNGNPGCSGGWDGIHAPDDSMCEPCKESLAVGLDALDYM